MRDERRKTTNRRYNVGLRALRKSFRTISTFSRNFTSRAFIEVIVYSGNQMFLSTDAYQSAVSGGDLKLLVPQLQGKLGLVDLEFKQLGTYGQKLIDAEGVPGAAKTEKDFLSLMKDTTERTLKFIPIAIQAVDAGAYENISSRTGKDVEQAMKELARDVPEGRYGQAEEVGYLAAFLASERAGYINGSMLAIDGGLIRSVF